MRRYLYWGISALAVGGVAVAIALFAGPTGEWGVPGGVASAQTNLLQSCTPGNQTAHPNGPKFHSSGSGTARFWESELEVGQLGCSSDGDESCNYAGGKIVWSFLLVATEDVTGTEGDNYSGDLYGFLVFTVKLDNGDEIKFHSRCLAEGETGSSGSQRAAELTAEGDVTGFPGNTSKQLATAFLKMKRDTSTRKVKMSLSMHLGGHCDDSGGEFAMHADSIESADCAGDPDGACGDGLTGRRESGVAAGVLKSPDSHAGVDSGDCQNDFQD